MKGDISVNRRHFIIPVILLLFSILFAFAFAEATPGEAPGGDWDWMVIGDDNAVLEFGYVYPVPGVYNAAAETWEYYEPVPVSRIRKTDMITLCAEPAEYSDWSYFDCFSSAIRDNQGKTKWRSTERPWAQLQAVDDIVYSSYYLSGIARTGTDQTLLVQIDYQQDGEWYCAGQQEIDISEMCVMHITQALPIRIFCYLPEDGHWTYEIGFFGK